MKKIISIFITICILLSTAIPVMAAGTTVPPTPIVPSKSVATALVPINLDLALTKTELKQGETLGFNISVLQGDKARSGQSLTVQLIDTRDLQIQVGEWETGVDGKYSGKFTLPLKSTAGAYKVVTTTYDDTDVAITKTAIFNVLDGSHKSSIKTDKMSYLAGENITISGVVMNGDKPQAYEDVALTIYKAKEQVKVAQVQTNAKGEFDFVWSVFDNASNVGDYTVVYFADGLKFEASFSVKVSPIVNHVQVTVDAATYLPQKEVKITGTADTFKDGKLVKGTEVTVTVAQGADVLFTKTVMTNSRGTFAVAYPTAELPGDFTVTATAGLASSTANFKVIDFPISNRVKVRIDASIYQPESVVKITGSAETFKGRKLVAGTEVTVKVTKGSEVLFTEKVIVDEKGKFATLYTTTENVGNYVVSATAGSAKDTAYFYVKPFIISYVLTAKTDKTSYRAGELATFSGQAKILKGQKVQPNTKVKVTLYKDGRSVKTTEVLVSADNTYSLQTNLTATGYYTFVAQLGTERAEKFIKVVRK